MRPRTPHASHHLGREGMLPSPRAHFTNEPSTNPARKNLMNCNDSRSFDRAHLPNEARSATDGWDDYEAVNNPASGKKLPNEGHAADDDWDDYEAVNDPASGKKLPNEGHATAVHNHVFDSLWVQADPRGLGRPMERCANAAGRRALKFRTRGFHRAMIMEADHRPGFAVRVCGFAEIPGLVDSSGIATFANPLETESLITLLSQVDRWTSSYENLFGEKGVTIQACADSTEAIAQARDHDLNVTQDDQFEASLAKDPEGCLGACEAQAHDQRCLEAAADDGAHQ